MMKAAELTNGDVLDAAIRALRALTGEHTPSQREEVATQLQTLVDTHTCFVKAAVNEPIFTLRAKDRIAPRVVKYWIKQAIAGEAVSELKIESAKRVRRQMKRFPGRRMPT